MAESKYSKYIIKNYITPEEKRARGRTPDERKPGVPFPHGLLWLDEKIVKDSFYMEVVFMEPGTKTTGIWVKPHTHDTDEIIGFVGTDVRNPNSLNSVVELWLGDEKETITESCLVFVPKGLTHGPLEFVKVGTPIVHFSVLTGGQYLWTDKSAK